MRGLTLFDTAFSDFLYDADAFFNRNCKRSVNNYQEIDNGEVIETYHNGRLHNEKGPAVSYKDKSKHNLNEYWLNGRKVTKDEVDAYREKKEDETPIIITIEGVEKKITGKQWKLIKAYIDQVTK